MRRQALLLSDMEIVNADVVQKSVDAALFISEVMYFIVVNT